MVRKAGTSESKGPSKERVELRFAPQNKHQFSVQRRSVNLLVELKNVPQLIVKIYEINSLNHYRNRQQPIGTNIDLDGLVANVERKFEYSQAAQLRTRRIDLPCLNSMVAECGSSIYSAADNAREL